MRIHVVAPVTSSHLVDYGELGAIARADVEVTGSFLEVGPPSIESEYDEAYALPDTITKIVQAERRGADAILIDCMGDPGLNAAREATSTLILGPAQTSMHVAALLAHNFSIITTLKAVVPLLHDLARKYGLAEKLCSIRSVEIPVLELPGNDELIDALTAESTRAIDVDGAHAIILGCTGMRGHAEALSERLVALGYEGIPVIDPIAVTLKMAEALADAGLTPSKLTFPTPREKTFVGYDTSSLTTVSGPGSQ